ncbi:hypothetical protein [Pontibacter oryzae]|uniref:Uncharacterized protein n=1 Tax=Pontibacter oryzae TaxID=2304593 RepID=A0A399SHJ3_9BACT|nr:hypothetical protein [Pontibacter oryzae]RIJ42309.1 hypothetical protein D1627_00060 [Pontibacter oryzae]
MYIAKLTPILSLCFCYQALAQFNLPPKSAQIEAALHAAPVEKKAGATVLGYNQQGKVVQLRKGTNEMICLADDPRQEGFSVSCYHQDLGPFMARGRTLREAGKNTKEIFAIREQEAKSGKLKMPAQPAALFVYSAPDDDVDYATGKVSNGYLRYVVYIPFATAAQTGLPLKAESPGMPWIMYPGTHGAHIMINPPRN